MEQFKQAPPVTYVVLEGGGDMRPRLLEILLAVLWKEGGKGRLLQKGTSHILLCNGKDLPVVNVVSVPGFKKRRERERAIPIGLWFRSSGGGKWRKYACPCGVSCSLTRLAGPLAQLRGLYLMNK